ncbi:MAG: hypothetical protein ABIP51_01115 [Bacteroidia bacterium]
MKRLADNLIPGDALQWVKKYKYLYVARPMQWLNNFMVFACADDIDEIYICDYRGTLTKKDELHPAINYNIFANDTKWEIIEISEL